MNTVIRLRWPALVLAVVTLAALLASLRWNIWFGRTLVPRQATWVGVLAHGNVIVQSHPICPGIDPLFSIEPSCDLGMRFFPTTRSGTGMSNIGPFVLTGGVPLWAVAVPATGAAIAGFVARRRRDVAGCCKRCRYPLRGASMCPECGIGSATAH